MPGSVSATLQDHRFLVLQTLGHGGMASVFGAFDRLEQRMVALKAPSDGVRAGPANPLSIEFDAWSRVRHPNVVEAYGLCTARSGPIPAGTPYLVLEFVGGGPAHRVLRAGRVTTESLDRLAVEILHGLAHVHAAGLIHRDVKPANVLVHDATDKGPRFKLTDFGLAARRGRRGMPGTISGSLPYVAPEALLGQPLDGRADLYGLGILLFYLATGEMPARSAKADDLLRWHLAGPPANPAALRPRLPNRLTRFIARLTARSPAQRPADCSEALSLLGASGATNRPDGPMLDRALRAKLRLALDAARLGARRCFVLPRCPGQSAELRRQVRVWAAIHGIGYHRLETVADCGPPALTRLILRLLIEHGARAARLAGHHQLERLLPLRLLAGRVPTWDRAGETGSAARAAAAAGDFLLACSAAATLTVQVESSAALDPIAREVVRRLELGLARPRPDPGRGGFLLVLDESLSSATPRDRPTRD